MNSKQTDGSMDNNIGDTLKYLTDEIHSQNTDLETYKELIQNYQDIINIQMGNINMLMDKSNITKIHIADLSRKLINMYFRNNIPLDERLFSELRPTLVITLKNDVKDCRWEEYFLEIIGDDKDYYVYRAYLLYSDLNHDFTKELVVNITVKQEFSFTGWDRYSPPKYEYVGVCYPENNDIESYNKYFRINLDEEGILIQKTHSIEQSVLLNRHRSNDIKG